MKALVVCKHPNDSKDQKACHLIKLKGFEIVYAWKNTLSKKDLKDIGLVISLGGDGTALSASHYLTSAPLLAVNDSPTTSVGALTTLNLDQLPKKLEQIQKGKYKTEKLERIEIKVNGKTLNQIALNDVFIGNQKPYMMTKYSLSYKSQKELQYSSGLIFSTGAGSTAWFNSAGGKPFPAETKNIKMITREPYKGKVGECNLKNLTIYEKESVTITIEVPCFLAIDSIREYSLKPNDKVKVKISKNPLIRIK
jgi:NAD kinase